MLKRHLTSNKEKCLWLVPTEPMRSVLRERISQLAIEFKSAPFDPHVTVFAWEGTDVEAHSVVKIIASSFRPISLTFQAIDHSLEFSKTLFLQFERSAELCRMYDNVKEQMTRKSNYALNPHLSLLYQSIDTDRRLALCNELNLPAGTYSFDSIKVIETESPLQNPGQVRRWRKIVEATLMG
jgi:2'-5' RNA ligase